MPAVSLLLVGLDAKTRAVAAEAARLAFSEPVLRDAATLDDALKSVPPAGGDELLVLLEPDPAALARAIAATDALGGQRWMIVVFGAGSAGAGVAAMLEAPDWHPRPVALVFQSALRLRALERENDQLRGDLSTIGRRISHDLRTPLAAIYNACEGLNEIKPEHAGDLGVFAQSIAASTNELTQLIGRMSFVLKASAEPLPREAVGMDEIVFSTLQRAEARILKSGATVTPPARWPTVQGVAAWLEVIWLNLLTNALEHAGPAPRIELGWSEAGGEFRFWVNDHGRGVAPEKTGKLFQPFHLLHRLNAPRGLGLSLVQRLVELQGGTCGYAPLTGGGAHFFFTLPAATPPARPRIA